ncbi:hypothetical protein B0H14DRAFT_3142479 [Mycena olivaceomarginata]|nr:hypothetical protein B0H14DRAFT_3142479 [Mycena olivaceomarginata]
MGHFTVVRYRIRTVFLRLLRYTARTVTVTVQFLEEVYTVTVTPYIRYLPFQKATLLSTIRSLCWDAAADIYGPTGAYIINSTITRVLANDEQKLGYALYGTLDDIITENYERFDDYDPDCDLISLREFIYFVLTPYAATLLISDDLDLDMEAAANVRHQSNIFGDVCTNGTSMQCKAAAVFFCPGFPAADRTTENPQILQTRQYSLIPLQRGKVQAEKKKPEKKPAAASKLMGGGKIASGSLLGFTDAKSDLQPNGFKFVSFRANSTRDLKARSIPAISMRFGLSLDNSDLKYTIFWPFSTNKGAQWGRFYLIALHLRSGWHLDSSLWWKKWCLNHPRIMVDAFALALALVNHAFYRLWLIRKAGTCTRGSNTAGGGGGSSSGACADVMWMERPVSHLSVRFADTSEQCEFADLSSPLRDGVSLAETFFSHTSSCGSCIVVAKISVRGAWRRMRLGRYYTEIDLVRLRSFVHCRTLLETDLSLITTICVCVLRSDFKLRTLASSKLDSRSGNIASMFNPALAPDAAGSAAPDFNFIFVIPESGMHRAHRHIGIRTIHHYRVALQRVADAITPMTPYPTPNQALMTILGLGKCENFWFFKFVGVCINQPDRADPINLRGVFEHSVAFADAGGVLRVLKYWAFSFRGAGLHNYARECLEIILQWKYELTPEAQAAKEQAWFFNRFGLRGRNIASDLYLEQNNFWVKVPSTTLFTTSKSDLYFSVSTLRRVLGSP